MRLCYETMTIGHYEAVYALWGATEGIGMSGADSREAISAFLARNPGLGFVCIVGGMVAGAVMAGHDGRRGFLYHLAVAKEHRRRGIGGELARRALDALCREGIAKCHIMVFADNEDGLSFWRGIGFEPRGDIALMSKSL